MLRFGIKSHLLTQILENSEMWDEFILEISSE